MDKISENDFALIENNLDNNFHIIIIMKPESYKFQNIGSRMTSLGFEGIYKSKMQGRDILSLISLDFIESVELDSLAMINEEE